VDAGEISVIPADVFRSHVMGDVRVSDTILEAFLARRALLLASAADTLQIVGSEFSPESMALREYAARNGLPHRWIDADPTNNLLPGAQHVTLAWGRDFGDVSPLRGVILGGGEQTLKVSVTMLPLDQLPLDRATTEALQRP
jgi:hypothetical protein